MGCQVRAGGLRSPRRSCRVTPKPHTGWRRPVSRCLVLLALLAQLFAPAGRCCSPDLRAQSSVETSGALAATVGAAAASVHCAHAGAVPGGSDDPTPSCPCRHDECPCCQLLHAAGLPPPLEMAQFIYAPPLSEIVAAPETLGSVARPAAFAGRPRGPPILI